MQFTAPRPATKAAKGAFPARQQRAASNYARALPDADGAYLTSCCVSLARLIGGLTGTKRVSLLPVAGAIGARRIASKRKMKISDSMAVLPDLAMWAHLVGAPARGKSA